MFLLVAWKKEILWIDPVLFYPTIAPVFIKLTFFGFASCSD